MSRDARKCDRCGRLYETYKTENDKLMSSPGCHTINAVMAIDLDNEGKYYLGKPKDLCPGCMKSFLRFMEKPEETL